MISPSSAISRRIEDAVFYYSVRDYERAMVNLFPAIDKTARLRRPRDGVGRRIKSFIDDEEALIWALATSNIRVGGRWNSMSFSEMLYKYGRTSIAHEGELDPRLTFNSSQMTMIGYTWILDDTWNLDDRLIIALIVTVILSPENASQRLSNDFSIDLFYIGSTTANSIWGDQRRIQMSIEAAFQEKIWTV